jgi:HAD superfamily hydrolase (TIGR01509 family)
MTLKALIFDVDGTIAETEELHRAAFNAAFAQAGLDWNWSVEDYARLLRVTGGKERIAAHLASLPAPPALAAEDIAALHRAKTARYVALVAGGALALRPGVQALLDRARERGLALAIATTTTEANVEALAQAVWSRPAREVFDVLATGDEVRAKKPAPDIYLLALARLGLRPAEAVAFEDSGNGVRSARAAGLRVVAARSVYSAGDDLGGATWLVPDLAADLPIWGPSLD